MTTERRLRADEHGLYVKTGGYVFRPAEGLVKAAVARGVDPLDMRQPDQTVVQTSQYQPGDKHYAQHLAGTPTAKVGAEWWGEDELTAYGHADFDYSRSAGMTHVDLALQLAEVRKLARTTDIDMKTAYERVTA